MEIKIGKRYLVREDYVTGGGDAFHADMYLWQKSPLIVWSVGGLYCSVESIASKGRHWLIKKWDLIPYRPAQLENK